jgi:HSP20 family protein
MALLVRRSPQTSSGATRWHDPFGELEDLHARTEQLMESFMTGAGTGNGAAWVPSVDIEETDDAWVFEAELPGAEQGDINVDMQGSELVISGDIKERERKGILRRRTRRTGSFEFRATLPQGVDADKIDASLKHGVLTVRVPKPEPARSRQIEITAPS